MIYAYIKNFERGSKNEEEINQKYTLINEYAQKERVNIKQWHIDALPQKILSQMQADDILLVTEIANLGKSLRDIRELINYCILHHLKIIIIKDNYIFESSLSMQLLVSTLDMVIKLHADIKSQNMRRSLRQRREDGKPLGRLPGHCNKEYKLSGKEDEIKKLLEQKVPKTRIAKYLGVNRMTLYAFLQKMQK